MVGYNLDLFVMGGLTGLCSIFGLPWMCAATVRSVQHQNALAILSRSHAPGERPDLLQIKEQRLTNHCIHILVGMKPVALIFFFCCTSFLKYSPYRGCYYITRGKLKSKPGTSLQMVFRLPRLLYVGFWCN